MPDNLPDGCATCVKAKTVHLTQIVGGDVNELHLCGECPWAEKVSAVETVNIVCEAKPSIELEAPGLTSTDRGRSCPECGYTQDTFKQSGRLGCPSCYEIFAAALEAVFHKAHRGVKHKGKVPSKFEAPVSLEEIQTLKQELEEHVAREEYEKAAELRDRIFDLESRIS